MDKSRFWAGPIAGSFPAPIHLCKTETGRPPIQPVSPCVSNLPQMAFFFSLSLSFTSPGPTVSYATHHVAPSRRLLLPKPELRERARVRLARHSATPGSDRNPHSSHFLARLGQGAYPLLIPFIPHWSASFPQLPEPQLSIYRDYSLPRNQTTNPSDRVTSLSAIRGLNTPHGNLANVCRTPGQAINIHRGLLCDDKADQ